MTVKNLILYLISLCFLAIIIFITSFYLFFSKTYNTKYQIHNFNKNDFQIIADKMLSLKNSTDPYTVKINCSNNKILCRLDNEIIEMTDDEQESLKKIITAFHNASSLDRINITKNRVTFCTEENWYEVIYIVKDSKMSFLNTLVESLDIKSKKLDKNWYCIYH